MTVKSQPALAGQVDRHVRPAVHISWCVVEAGTGMQVAKGYSPTEEDARREAGHYAMQYAQDGPVIWWVRVGRNTVFRAKMDLRA